MGPWESASRRPGGLTELALAPVWVWPAGADVRSTYALASDAIIVTDPLPGALRDPPPPLAYGVNLRRIAWHPRYVAFLLPSQWLSTKAAIPHL